MFALYVGVGNRVAMAIDTLQMPTESDWNIAYTLDCARRVRRDSIECRQRAAALRREAVDIRRAHTAASDGAAQYCRI
jgi:hypothetical protein